MSGGGWVLMRVSYTGGKSPISVHWSRFLTAGCTMQLRIKEHRRALTNGDPCMSALAEHAINNHHDIAWEDAIVVDADPHMYRHRTLNAWHIRQEPRPMNRDRGLFPLVYDTLVRTHPPPDILLCR